MKTRLIAGACVALLFLAACLALFFVGDPAAVRVLAAVLTLCAAYAAVEAVRSKEAPRSLKLWLPLLAAAIAAVTVWLLCQPIV